VAQSANILMNLGIPKNTKTISFTITSELTVNSYARSRSREKTPIIFVMSGVLGSTVG
jgi:hypothetical protein